MIKISSIILAKNEEQNIARCIDSQKNCIDEIIVIIDSKTEDNTLSIVESKSVRYEVKNWMGFAQTKTYAVSLCSYDWILWIDSDEALTPELCKEIQNLKNLPVPYSAFSIPRKANFLGKWIKHSGWYPARVVRLFNKQKACFNDKDVHEHLDVNGTIGKLYNDIEHWTDPTIEHYFRKFNKYTSLAAKELSEKNKRATLMDLLVRPPFLFFKMFILRLGFLDGIHGFILAVFSSAYVFTKYSKLKELNEQKYS